MLLAVLLRWSLAVAAPDAGPVEPGSSWPQVTAAELELSWVDEPLEADPPMPLSCKPLPKCAAAALSTAAERDLGVWAWNGRGLQSATPRQALTTAGYVDLTRKTWVPLEADPLLDEGERRFAGPQLLDDLRLIRLLGHPASPLVALGIGPDAVSTAEGFGVDFTTWRVIDLVQRRVRLVLTSAQGEVREVGPGPKVRVRTYHWALPPQCPGGAPGEHSGRALPPFAVEATWDVVTGKRVTAFQAWSTDFEHGPRPLGLCRLKLR